MNILRRLGTFRFDLVDVTGIAAVSVALLLAATSRRSPEGEEAWLASKYGPRRHSQFAEEWIIRDFFRDQRGGFFVDVGAAHYRYFSNTYYLETRLGWSGIAVDALAEFGPDYSRYRPRTKFFSFFVSDRTDASVSLFVLEDNSFVSSSTPDFTLRWGAAPRERRVATIRLDDLLGAEGVRRLDLLSMDIELAEPTALAGFDLGRFRPRLVCIEAHPEVRQQILDYFARRSYVVVGRYLRADEHNLYFAPLQREE